MSVSTVPATEVPPSVIPLSLTDKDRKLIRRLTGANLTVGVLALTLGLAFGVMQGLEHARVIDLYPFLQPVIKTYYQGLTLHGALNAIVWTTFFICGFFTYAFTHSLNRPLRYTWINITGFWVMLIGLVMTAVPILTNNAIGALHLLLAHAGDVALLCGPDAAGGRLVAGGSRHLLHLLRVAQGEPRRASRPSSPSRRPSRWPCGNSPPWAWRRKSSSRCCPIALGLVDWDGSAARPHPLLVVWPPAGLLLAAARLRLLVRHAAGPDQRQDV